MKQVCVIYKGRTINREVFRRCFAAVACGFLLTKGLAGAVRCADWDMPSLMGMKTASVWGAAIFGIACAAVCLVLKDYGAGGAAIISCCTAALYTLHCLLVSPCAENVLAAAADGAAVLISIIAVRSNIVGVIWLSLLALLLIPAKLCPMPTLEPVLMLRMVALTGVLSSAGLCGISVARLSGSSIAGNCGWLIAGAALGLL